MKTCTRAAAEEMVRGGLARAGLGDELGTVRERGNKEDSQEENGSILTEKGGNSQVWGKVVSSSYTS